MHTCISGFCSICGSHHGWLQQKQHLLDAVIHPDFSPVSICCGTVQERICAGGKEGRRGERSLFRVAQELNDVNVGRAKNKR